VTHAAPGKHGARRRATRSPVPSDRASDSSGQAQDSRSGLALYLAVLAGVLVALVIISQGAGLVRSGTLVFASVLLLAAMARLVMPERRVGMLSSRRRLLDVAFLGVLGIGLLVAGLVVPVPS
jgi:hypothetical protein